jgi:phosphoglucomutase
MLPMSRTGTTKPAQVPEFGAACDGDADRNMVLGAACWQHITLLDFQPLC